MKMILFGALLLILPRLSHGAAVKPDSAEGRRIVHRLALRATDIFVSAIEELNGTRGKKVFCETEKKKLFADLDRLELSSQDLISAKRNLERSVCATPGAATAELRQAQNGMLAVTLDLRAADQL